MRPPALPHNESKRLQVLHSLHLLDTPPDPALDRLTRLATRLFQVPVALVTLVDEERQWFLSRAGWDICETSRRDSLCGHAILGTATMVVADTLLDERFEDNPLVVGSPGIRFYAGRPLRSREGLALGTLCLIDLAPRHFSAADKAALNDLAQMVEAHFHGIEVATDAQAVKLSLERSDMLFARTVTHAAVGIAVGTPEGHWLEVNDRFCEIVGHSRPQLIGAAATDIVDPLDVEAARTLG